MNKSILLLFLPVVAFSQQVKEDFTSKETGDTYEIIIRKPKDFDSSRAYHMVYFTDAAINSGKTPPITTRRKDKELCSYRHRS